MSGKLKFRVWNPTYEEMLYPSSPTKNGDYEEKIYLQLDGQLIGDFKHTGLVNCSENYVIQQFTGMLDNNGKEIYEGDVIRGYFDMGPAGMTINTTIVRWTNKEGYQWKYWDLNSIEVLGNIFENKEMKSNASISINKITTLMFFCFKGRYLIIYPFTQFHFNKGAKYFSFFRGKRLIEIHIGLFGICFGKEITERKS